MLALSKKLINLLNERQISYCSWKNNQDLKKALEGDGDADLLIAFKDCQTFLGILNELGFREAGNRAFFFPYVHHYYGNDEATGTLLHLHVYYKMITGESQIKNFHFPIEDELIASCSVNEMGIKIPGAEWQLLVYLLRYYIKISCLPGMLLYFREAKGYQKEYDLIFSGKSQIADLPTLFNDEKLSKELRSKFEKGFLTKMLFGVRLRGKLKHLNRFGFLATIRERNWQILYRAINKIFLKRRKKLETGGRLIAITGLDGSGKSTSLETIRKWLGKYFDVLIIHAGRPPTTLLTLPVRILLFARRSVKNKGRELTLEEILELDKKCTTGTISALRYAVLAYERNRQLNKAYKKVLKGNIVLCDRYPSMTIGKMDSPRIDLSEPQGALITYLGKLEQRFYQAMPKPDLILKMTVPVEVALERNRARQKENKETDDGIRARYMINQGLEYNCYEFHDVNANVPKEEMLNTLKQHVWKSL